MDFAVELEPNFRAPAFIARRIIRKEVAALLQAMRGEIQRRSPPAESITQNPTKIPPGPKNGT